MCIRDSNRAGFTLAYAIAAILWIFAVSNQIKLTVTNLLSQKQEMGTLKSMGMTNKQLKQAFMMEGLFTTLIALLITAVVGIPGGYEMCIRDRRRLFANSPKASSPNSNGLSLNVMAKA